MSYKISVIIPCYNAKNTLKRCIESVINQTFGFGNIELILYDDASTDNTKKIIESYAKQYKNIVPIYSAENSGFPVRGRNKGIKIAKSDYIMFMDNDDEYDLNVCEFFYNEIEKTGVDFISCGKKTLDNTTTNYSKNNPQNKEKINISKENLIYFEDRFIWNKIFKKSILIKNNILFPEDKYAEDFYFITRYLLHCNSLISVPDYQGYIRHIQEDSISRTWTLNDLIKILDVDYMIYNELRKFENINYSRFFKREIWIFLYKTYSLHLLDNKSEVINYLNELYSFEMEIKFDEKLNGILKIANMLLLKRKFNLCYSYLKLLEKVYTSNNMKKIYRKIIGF